MRPWLLFLLMVALALGVAELTNRAPSVLAKMEVFRVTAVDLQGNRFLTEEEVVTILALPPLASVWDDRGALEEKLGKHPLVRWVRVGRRFPGTLLVSVQEKAPVALVPNPTLEPVDAAGAFLPIDPAAYRLDLPLITLGDRERVEGLSAAERNLVAAEIARLAQGDPDFLARVSEVSLEQRGELRAELFDPPMELFFRPNLPSRRIQEGLRVLGDARDRFQGTEIAGLDLRYEDQVVVRLLRAEGN
jgi:cell division septal protein FtsQ